MRRLFEKYFRNFFTARWTIGLAKCDIEDIIRRKTFNPVIHWLKVSGLYEYKADPFIFSTGDGYTDIIYEDFSVKDDYGNISIMRIDNKYNIIESRKVIDIQQHLSYPLVLNENGKSYIFPEAASTGKFSCYEYDNATGSAFLLRDIINLPLLDATILKHNGKYWIFGVRKLNNASLELYIFFSESLFGPYNEHKGNPVRKGLDGSRFAGNFIKVDNIIYRPAQNCEKTYGESITIYRINLLSEQEFEEEPYMNIEIERNNKHNRNMHSIHTINAMDGIIAVDGEQWIFAPLYRIINYLKKKIF